MSLYTPNQEEKERFMSRAIELSNEGPSKGHGGPYGAIIVKDGEIIGKRFCTGRLENPNNNLDTNNTLDKLSDSLNLD